MNWYIKVIKNYVTFKGRARRKEYWFFILFNVIISIALTLLDSLLFGETSIDNVGILHTVNIDNASILSTIYSLAIFLPSLAVSVRRLHDTGRTGWWLLIALIPLVGAIVLLIFMVQDSKPGTNQFGANPKEFTANNPFT